MTFEPNGNNNTTFIEMPKNKEVLRLYIFRAAGNLWPTTEVPGKPNIFSRPADEACHLIRVPNMILVVD